MSKQTKFLVYTLIVFLFSSNQAVLASSMFHRHQHETQSNTSLHYLHNQKHDQLQIQDQMADSHFISLKDHDHKKYSECDGADHCNHCVNILSSVYSTSANTFQSSPILGLFASYYDLTLPSDFRPPRHA